MKNRMKCLQQNLVLISRAVYPGNYFAVLLSIVCLLFTYDIKGQEVPDPGKTKIFTVFLGRGYDVGRIYYGRSVLGPDGVRRPKTFLSNQDLLAKLKETCKEVEFIARESSDYDRLIKEIGEMKDQLDGIMVFGCGWDYHSLMPAGTEGQPLMFTGLPTIHVSNMFELQSGCPFELFAKEGKILTASLDRENNLVDPNATKELFDNLVNKIRLIEVVKKMKEAKILMIAAPSYNYSGSDYKIFPPRYNEMYTARLKEVFGTEIIAEDVDDFLDYLNKMGDKEIKEAEKIAKMWMDEAKEIRDVTKEEIVEAAKLYLTMENFRQKHEPDALLVSSLSSRLFSMLSMGNMELNRRNIHASYQPQLDCILAQIVGYFMTGRMSYLHDIAVDPYNNVTLHMHCESPVKDVWGDKELPYIIRDYTSAKWDEELQRKDGVIPVAEFPMGVPVTIWKIQLLQKRILLWTGTSVDGNTLYKDFENIMCRQKVAVKVEDAKKIRDSVFNVHEYGCHMNLTFGDLREQVRQFAKLTGFDFIEVDR